MFDEMSLSLSLALALLISGNHRIHILMLASLTSVSSIILCLPPQNELSYTATSLLGISTAVPTCPNVKIES